MIGRLFTQPVTVIPVSTGLADRYGDATKVAGIPVATFGYLEQRTAVEVIVDRDTYSSEWVGFLPEGTVVGPADHLLFDGVSYEVIGPPHRVWNPRTGGEHHVECQLRVVSG